MARNRRASSIFVISDLHLGGQPPAMMGRPDRLAAFIDGLPARLGDAPGSALELVIAGDFVDFLATAPSASFTPDPRAACDKLVSVMGAPSPFAPVFDALGRHVAAGHRLTVLLGNHDLELALPPVQQALLDRIDADAHEVCFVADGRAYRIGGVLIEHGNRYDGANANDWTGLRAVASALSRGEAPNDTLRASAGSEIVHRVINPLKQTYPFVDLLQPQGELVALLLLAFEPALRWQWDKIARMLHAAQLEKSNAGGQAPSETRSVAAAPLAVHLPHLRDLFVEAYDALRSPSEEVALADWLSLLVKPDRDGLAAIYARGERVPPARLAQVRAVMRELLLSDGSDRLDGPAAQYGEAARRMIAEGQGIDVVVMGHTHLPRRIDMGSGVYLNTGTWVDRFRAPDAVLADGADDALDAWLKALSSDDRRPLPPTFGELRLDEGGRVMLAQVKEVAAA
jgi:UDP-2,3-diacylglucosamine pyrophosphatase LpxH